MEGMVIKRIMFKVGDVRYIQTCKGCGLDYFYKDKETFLVKTGLFGLGKKVKVSCCSHCFQVNPVPDNPVMNVPIADVEDIS